MEVATDLLCNTANSDTILSLLQLANPNIPAQVKEMVRKIQAIVRARLTQEALDRETRRKEERKLERKKLKLTRQKRVAKAMKRLKRKALRFARSLNRCGAFAGSFLFILIATYFNLIFAIKFEPTTAREWLFSGLVGLSQQLLLVEPIEILYGSIREYVLETAGETYMREGGGDRIQAGTYKWQQISELK